MIKFCTTPGDEICLPDAEMLFICLKCRTSAAHPPPPGWHCVVLTCTIHHLVQIEYILANHGMVTSKGSALEGGTATFCRVRAAGSRLLYLSRSILQCGISIPTRRRLGLAGGASSRDRSRCCSTHVEMPDGFDRYSDQIMRFLESRLHAGHSALANHCRRRCLLPPGPALHASASCTQTPALTCILAPPPHGVAPPSLQQRQRQQQQQALTRRSTPLAAL